MAGPEASGRKRARERDASTAGATAAADTAEDVAAFARRLGRWGGAVRRGRGARDGEPTLVATAFTAKGETIVADPPLAAVQALANRGRFLACAHCLAPAGDDTARHLALAAGRVSRRDLVAAAVESERRGADVQPRGVSPLPRLAPRGANAREGPTPCRRARGGCLEVFCGDACRDAARGWHAMTCVGSCGEGSPVFEFRTHARRAHESFLLAADALARALADAGGSDGVAEGEAESADGSRVSGLGSSVLTEAKTNSAFPNRDLQANRDAASRWTRLFASLPAPAGRWWDKDRARVVAGEDASARAKSARRAARRAEHLREQIEDAHQLLFMAWGHARGLRSDPILMPFLKFETFERLVAAVDRSAQPLNLEHPGTKYARDVSAAAGDDARACASLRAAARDAENLSAENLADDSDQASSSSEDESTGDSSSSDNDDDENDDDDDDDSSNGDSSNGDSSPPARRREGTRRGSNPSNLPEDVARVSSDDDVLDLVETATASFPRLAALALAPAAALAGHSCLPNSQVEMAFEGESDWETGVEKDEKERGSGVCGALRVSLVALRDIAPGEAITVARVPVARPVAERHAELIALFGETNTDTSSGALVCACARCAYELGSAEDVVSVLSARDLCALADQASEEGRHEDAERCARLALKADRDLETGAAHKVGVALLGQGRWAEAHEAWAEAYASQSERRPPRGVSAALAAQVAKDRAYSRRADDVSSGKQTVAETKTRVRSPVALHPSAGIFTSEAFDAPFLTPEECADWISLAEAAAAARGGWTTARHYAVPTTDLPVHEIPTLLPLWNAFLSSSLGPFLHACFPTTVRFGGSNVRVHDAFVVRYDADAQRFLPAHVDQSEISVTLALNALGEYEGGGTTFPDPLRVTARPDIGGVVAFGGDLRHAGAPVTRGVRYIVAAFLFTV